MASSYERKFPEGLKRLTTGCQYCAVGCGYNAFLTPAPGGAKDVNDTSRFITPAMRPARQDPTDPSTTGKVYYNGNLKEVAVAPDVRCGLNKGNHSVRGASQGLNLVAYEQTTGSTPIGASTNARLTSPWVRLDSGTWKEITWSTLNKVMSALIVHATDMETDGGSIKINNPRGLGVKLYEYQFLENTYAATKLFYGALGTPNVAFHDRPSATGSSPGLKDAGLRPHDFAYEDIQSSDLIVMIGTNPYENQSVFFMQYCQGKEIVVIDPRRTATADYAERTGGMHIQPNRLGADSRLIYAIARSLIERWEIANPGSGMPPTMPKIGDLEELLDEARNESNGNNRQDKKRRASRALTYESFKEFLGVSNPAETTYALEEAADAAGLTAPQKTKLNMLVERLLVTSKANKSDQPKIAILYEKGMIWGFNYHNTAALASLGVLLGAGTEAGRILGRVGGHQKGWAERVEPLKSFKFTDIPDADRQERYPLHNATDRYTDRRLESTFADTELNMYGCPRVCKSFLNGVWRVIGCGHV